MFENLLLEREGTVAVVTVNRPQVLNALNGATIDELERVGFQLRQDVDVRAVIITGAGDKAFVAGADIRELADPKTDLAAYARRGQRAFTLFENLGKPTIAAINGFALGGGCELAMACTVRIAADTARLGQPEIDLGLVPGFGGTQRLPRLVGRGPALELLLTGRHVAADEALRLGLVNRVVPAVDLAAQAMRMAQDLAGKAPIAVRSMIEAVNRGLDLPLEAGQSIEATLFGHLASTADMREGTRAFLDKRKPVFKGA